VRFSINKNQNSASLISSHYCQHSEVFIFAFIFSLFLSQGRAGEAWEPSKWRCFIPLPLKVSCYFCNAFPFLLLLHCSWHLPATDHTFCQLLFFLANILLQSYNHCCLNNCQEHRIYKLPIIVRVTAFHISVTETSNNLLTRFRIIQLFTSWTIKKMTLRSHLCLRLTVWSPVVIMCTDWCNIKELCVLPCHVLMCFVWFP
jgi:hypothetical protein